MNLTKLKNYAPAARTAIITAVTRRAATLGIQAGRVEEVTESGNVALIGGQPFPRSIVPLRKQLLDLIHRDGFDHTMEAMAYTWFNRLVALRFMELHDGYLDHGYRVLSHPQGTPLPEILQHAEHVSLKGLDREEVIRLKLDGNRDEELYRLLLLAQCAELNQILPDVFSKLDDATILLLPDNLLHSDSVIRQLVAGSDAEDWQQVEVLGWLYQFYISEKKDAVMARKSAVPTEDIPAVTQLFTPHWIVRYLVENSLGRLWLLNRPGSRLREHMPYYIEGEAETDFLKISKPEDIKLLDPASGSGHMLTYAFDLLVLIYEEEGYAANDIPGLILKHNLYGTEICPRAAQLAELALVFKAREKSRRFFSSGNLVRPNIIELRDVRYEENELRDYLQAVDLDPYFESQAREWIKAGTLLSRQDHFDASETASTFLGLLVAKGVLGSCLDFLDLDPRLHAKLRKLILSGKDIRDLSSPETRNLEQAAFRIFAKSGEMLKYAAELNLGDLSKQIHLKLLHQFEESKNFGSLIQPCLTEAEVQSVRSAIRNSKSIIQNSDLMVAATHLKVLRVLEQAEALTQRYHVVVANPPYMGQKQMNPMLKTFVEEHLNAGKSDLFAAFTIRNLNYTPESGFIGMITIPNWMFLESFEDLRKQLLNEAAISTLIHNGRGLWGADFGSCAFVLHKTRLGAGQGSYKRLFSKPSEVNSPEVIEERFLDDHHFPWLLANTEEFKSIPGYPIAYWISPKVRSAFSAGSPLSQFGDARQGLATADNDRFLRLWFEPSSDRIRLRCRNRVRAAI